MRDPLRDLPGAESTKVEQPHCSAVSYEINRWMYIVNGTDHGKSWEPAPWTHHWWKLRWCLWDSSIEQCQIPGGWSLLVEIPGSWADDQYHANVGILICLGLSTAPPVFWNKEIGELDWPGWLGIGPQDMGMFAKPFTGYGPFILGTK